MIERIALTGGMLVGKSTLTKELHEKHGYFVVDFSRQLKELAADALSNALYKVGLPEVWAVDIESDKTRYRPFLQEFGSVIGYNNNPRYVELALEPWTNKLSWSLDSCPVVFDNVRTPEQWQVLKDRGFTLVHLFCPKKEWMTRAYHSGLFEEEMERYWTHSLEQGVKDEGALYADTHMHSPSALADMLVETTTARS